MTLTKAWVPERRDVIWIDCNPQAGKEMRDFHPFLVLSVKAFNIRTGIVIGFPMTTAVFNETNPFAVKFDQGKGTVSYILTHQPKSFDWRQRHAKQHPMKRVPEAVFRTACTSLNRIILLTA